MGGPDFQRGVMRRKQQELKWLYLKHSLKCSLMSMGYSMVLIVLLQMDPEKYVGLQIIQAWFAFLLVLFVVLAAGLLVLSFFVKEE